MHLTVQERVNKTSHTNKRNDDSSTVIQCTAEVHAPMTPPKTNMNRDSGSVEKRNSESSAEKRHGKHSPHATLSKYFRSAHNGNTSSSSDEDGDHGSVSKQQVCTQPNLLWRV